MMKPVWTPVKIRLGDIICWEHNPRTSNKAQAQRLIDSERHWGQPMTFAVSPFDENGKVNLYDGHQRYSAWLTVYGENYEVDARQCDRFLTEEERLEFVVTMHAGATGSWDWQKLSSFPAPKLIEMGFDGDTLRTWNLDALNLREMINSEAPIDYQAEWEGMPEFENPPKAFKSLMVHFENKESYDEFCELINQKLTEKSTSTWYPEKERRKR